MKPSSFIWVWASLAILLLAVIASFPSKWSSSSMAADLLLTNALIFTSDDSIPFADSIAIGRGRILRVGNYSSLKALVGYSTKELNLNGKIVVPGFIDSHVHLISGGLQLMRLQFRGINKKDEFVRRIAEAAETIIFQIENQVPGFWVAVGTMIYGEEICQLLLGLMILLQIILFGYQELMVIWAWQIQWH